MPEPPEYVRKWTFLLFQLNALTDSGETLDIGETSRQIEAGTLFEWLAREFPFPKLDLSPYGRGGVYPSEVMLDVLQRIDNGMGAQKVGVSNNGLAKLVAYGLQAIQQAE